MYVELGVGLLEMELQFGYLILGVGVARAVLCKRYVKQWRGASLSNTYGADWRLGDITIHHMVEWEQQVHFGKSVLIDLI